MASTALNAAIDAILAIHLAAPEGRPIAVPPEETHRLAQALSEVLAQRGQAGLAEELVMGLAAASRRLDRMTLAVTGLGWLGSGVPAVERTMTELLARAEREVLVTAYSMTPGSGRVWEALEAVLATGVRCSMVAHRIDEQHGEIRSLLLELRRRHAETFSLYNFTGSNATDALHAKILVVDRRAALVGSPNLTFHGLVSAHELAVVVRGPTAEQIAGRIDLLLHSRLVTPYPG